MVPKTWIMAALVAAVTLAGCTSGSDGGAGDGTSTMTTTGSGGIGGNVTVGNNTANATASASYSMTGTNSTGNGSVIPDSAQVSIEEMAYVNATVTIQVGGTVTWTHNDGTTPHTVTADDDSFDSSPNCEPSIGPLPPTGDCMLEGDVFTWTFTTTGEHTYHCKIHGGMTGTVRVVE